MSRAPGFSLIELVVVMVIAAILAAIAIPRLTDTETRATWFNDQAKAAIRYAQRQAVAQHRPVYVDVQPGFIRLCYVSDCSSQILSQITDGSPYVVTAPTGVTISPTVTFSFDALGRPTAGVVLDLSGKAITVNAETGYVQ
jgi:MSHA pilin protein MshC